MKDLTLLKNLVATIVVQLTELLVYSAEKTRAVAEQFLELSNVLFAMKIRKWKQPIKAYEQEHEILAVKGKAKTEARRYVSYSLY
jgi:hypothetical protein